MTGGLASEMAKILCTILFLLISPVYTLHASGQEEDDEIKGLHLTYEQFPEIGRVLREALYTADNLSKFSPKEARVIEEYGFVRLVDRLYESRYGEIELEIYQMRDFKAAFGLYTYFKGPKGKTFRVGDGGYATSREAIVWQDKVCLRVRNKSGHENAISLTRRMAQSISGKIPRHSALPVLITYLADNGLQQGSVRYFLGPEGFHRYYDLVKAADLFKDEVEIEVAAADYKLNGYTGKLILLGYPNHPLAIHYFPSVVSAMQKSKKENEAVYLKRAGVLVAILMGDFDQPAADKILGEVTYADSVKWIYDKRGLLGRRGSAYNALPLLGTVVNSFVFIGLICSLSIIFGVITGGLRFYFERQASAERAGRPVMIRLKLDGR